MIRGFIPILGTWGFVANTLYSQPWLIQPVSIFSIFGLGLLRTYPKNRTSGIPMPLIPTHRDASVTFFG